VLGNFVQFGKEESGRSQPNTIDIPAKIRKLTQSQKAQQEELERQARKTAAAAAARAMRIPDVVRERFIQIGNQFHFPDGTDAFTYEGNRLSTRSENTLVVQSMVAIAHEQGSKTITVGGTDRFKAEAWFAAGLVGMEVKGYQPSDFERERLVRAIAARRGPSENAEERSADAENSVQHTDRRTDRQRNAESEDGPRSDRQHSSQQRSSGRELILGRLVDHGPAHYHHDPKQPMNYFARIETLKGDREIWGVDLERAFRHSLSTPNIGDEVGLRGIGQQSVTVLAAKHDAQGRQIGTEPVETHRNEWIIERKGFLEERQRLAEVLRDTTLDAKDAIRRHPELEGSYLQLQLGTALAEQQFKDKGQRAQFVDHLRNHIAQRIEYGQPLEPMRMRAESRTVPPRRQDRDYTPA
jgi:putative DNA primase/helicase